MSSPRRIDDNPPGPGRAASPPSWPVLARLPLATGPGATDRSSPRSADAPLRDEREAEAPASRERRAFVDRPHGRSTIGSFDVAAVEAPPARKVEHYTRTDPGVGRPPILHVDNAPEPPPSLAEFAFRMHAAIAPYAALLATAALMTLAGVLYWLSHASTPSASRGQEQSLPNVWSVETTGSAVEPKTTTRVATLPAEKRDSVRETAGPAAPTESGPTLGAPIAAPEQVGPTAGYPTTGYPAFDFDAVATAPGNPLK